MDIKKRVKVYQLDGDGKWEDKGTGYISFVTYNNIQYILVKSEVDASTILESKIQSDEPYQKQQDSLIVWTDPLTSIDLALSFQDPQGCQEIWDGIENYQYSRLYIDYDLPTVSLDNLSKIQDLLDPLTLDQKEKEKVANSVTKEYIEQILDLFEEHEKSEEKSIDRTIFYTFFHIFKNLILFNDTSIFESLLSEEYIIRVLGALEYDPEISEQNRIKHREFLNHNVIFKTVGLDSKPLIGMIHQTFRIQYLKDVVLPRILDDATFSSLNSIIYFNNIDIVTQIQSDSNFLQQLFSKIQKITPVERTDYLLFLQELCNLAKILQIQNKISFFNTLKSFDLFKTLSSALDDENINQNRLSSTEIILSTLLHDPSILRKYITEDPQNHKFLSQLIHLFIHDRDIGIKNQIVEILKILLDFDMISDTSDFFKLFYEKGIYELVSPLDNFYNSSRKSSINSNENNNNNNNNNNNESNSDSSLVGTLPMIPGDPSSNLESFVIYNVIELIIYCIKHHLFRIKNFIIQEGITKKILRYANSNEKYLVLGAIRFFRSLVSMKDEIYNKLIISENLFDTVVEILKHNIAKNNLLNSAVIELFQFIYKENIKDLVIHLVDKYRDLFESIQYTDVPKHLILKYEQIKDGTNSAAGSGLTSSSLTASNIQQSEMCNNSNNHLKLNNLYHKAQKEFQNDEDEVYFDEDDDDDEEDDDDDLNNHKDNGNNSMDVDKQQQHQATPITKLVDDYEDEPNTTSNDDDNDESSSENGDSIPLTPTVVVGLQQQHLDSPSNFKKRKFEEEDEIDNDEDTEDTSNSISPNKHNTTNTNNNNNNHNLYNENHSPEHNGTESTDHRTKRLKLIYENENDTNQQQQQTNNTTNSPSELVSTDT